MARPGIQIQGLFGVFAKTILCVSALILKQLSLQNGIFHFLVHNQTAYLRYYLLFLISSVIISDPNEDILDEEEDNLSETSSSSSAILNAGGLLSQRASDNEDFTYGGQWQPTFFFFFISNFRLRKLDSKGKPCLTLD